MLVELLKPATPGLARRWLAALLAVPESERELLVRDVEAAIAKTYASGHGADQAIDAAPALTSGEAGREFDVVHPPRAKDGYVEQTITTYVVPQRRSAGSSGARGPSRGA